MQQPTLTWRDPREKIWGFHVHQELPLNDFGLALVIQRECAQFLKSHGTTIHVDEANKPGYGPHIDYMWELRIESDEENVLDKLGLAMSFMSLNRFGLSAYIHPLMHNKTLSVEKYLAEEYYLNQANTLWFSYKVKQNLEFFINPPKDKHGNIIDTQNILTTKEKANLYKNDHGKSFKDPHHVIQNGFHIHMDYTPEDKETALTIYDNFMYFLNNNNFLPTSARILEGGWEVKYETPDKTVLRSIGMALGWLMCNRQKLPVFMLPVTWQSGDVYEELRAHENYSMFMGHLPRISPSAQSRLHKPHTII